MNTEFKDLYIGDLKIQLPIIQGGMGVRVSNSSLVSAVSNEGALGVIAAVGLGEEFGIKELGYTQRSCASFTQSIRQTRQKTKNPFGVNIMCVLTNYEDLVNVAQNESVDVIISGAGLPLKLPALIKNTKTKLIPIVSSARAASIICSTWQRRYKRLPDALIVEGPLAGGHLGYSLAELEDKENCSLENILAKVVSVAQGFQNGSTKIPVIAAGGIFDGKDIAKFIRLGASGVQMGTRFVCTHECDVAQEYKEAYLAAKQEDIVVIQSPVGLPGRVIRNEFVKRIMQGARIDFDCQYHCLYTCDPKKVNYCIAKALLNASRGQMEKGFAMCGSNAYRIERIVSVKELISELVDQARASLRT
ncbi:MAG: nitronate monooxygenase family protein [Candidatus Omnitrophica bacterium]|nr:nitronate monooxygenase family protein [Candidatus Omnitrophota bacterium]MBU4303824.1 nitronate monooxygenase family protein [Candidatus Omnitrophota bacterium]MBU4418894.1 nitronate monooxygenase family protein [Candidatus Omnitrophota bacterium]MBU4468015.1 nitronate monooxygenase family protein [Candidatus Omnitrophota bacterium]MCG2707812.1 nitronate monooxygenase family protein [Candidatus Omnitrophota bacterium]